MVGWIDFYSLLFRFLPEIKHTVELVLTWLHLILRFLQLCFSHFIVFSPRRIKNQRKAVVTTVDKKIPNGILEEQGNDCCELNIVVMAKQVVDCESDRLTFRWGWRRHERRKRKWLRQMLEQTTAFMYVTFSAVCPTSAVWLCLTSCGLKPNCVYDHLFLLHFVHAC